MEIPPDKDIELMDKIFNFEIGIKPDNWKSLFKDIFGFELQSEIHRFIRKKIKEFNDEITIYEITNPTSPMPTFKRNIYTDRFIEKYGSFKKYYEYKKSSESFVKEHSIALKRFELEDEFTDNIRTVNIDKSVHIHTGDIENSQITGIHKSSYKKEGKSSIIWAFIIMHYKYLLLPFIVCILWYLCNKNHWFGL